MYLKLLFTNNKRQWRGFSRKTVILHFFFVPLRLFVIGNLSKTFRRLSHNWCVQESHEQKQLPVFTFFIISIPLSGFSIPWNSLVPPMRTIRKLFYEGFHKILIVKQSGYTVIYIWWIKRRSTINDIPNTMKTMKPISNPFSQSKQVSVSPPLPWSSRCKSRSVFTFRFFNSSKHARVASSKHDPGVVTASFALSNFL